MAKIVVDAGPLLWSKIRSLAAHSGLNYTESKGWFSRTFVLTGKVEDVRVAYQSIQEWQKILNKENEDA